MEHSLLEDGRLEVRAACLGLAGTVIEGNVKLTNLNWEVDETSLALAFGIKRTWRLNDMVATANAIPPLTQADLRKSTTVVRVAIGPWPFAPREQRLWKRSGHRHQRARTPRLPVNDRQLKPGASGGE